ncbi:MAG: hypothetical protein ACNA7J_09640 [Wenzhouxiangella sp.]
MGKQRTALWASLAIGGSLLIHGFILLLPGLRAPIPETRDGLDVTLAVLPPKAPEPVEPQAERTPDAIEPTLAEPEPTRRPEPPVRLLVVEPDGPSAPEPPGVPQTRLTGQQILATIRQDESWLHAPDQTDSFKAAPLPALPDSPGWINDYVGTVTSSTDRWQANDGSRGTRTVLASGQIICGQIRAPTMAEMFNPSFSVNIATFWNCGRERPEPVDRSNPWIRAPQSDTGVRNAAEQ